MPSKSRFTLFRIAAFELQSKFFYWPMSRKSYNTSLYCIGADNIHNNILPSLKTPNLIIFISLFLFLENVKFNKEAPNRRFFISCLIDILHYISHEDNRLNIEDLILHPLHPEEFQAVFSFFRTDEYFY